MTVPFESGPFVLSVNRSVPLTGPFVLARNRSVNRTGPVRSGPFVRTGGQKPPILSYTHITEIDCTIPSAELKAKVSIMSLRGPKNGITGYVPSKRFISMNIS